MIQASKKLMYESMLTINIPLLSLLSPGNPGVFDFMSCPRTGAFDFEIVTISIKKTVH
jgi:hypothetical protein